MAAGEPAAELACRLTKLLQACALKQMDVARRATTYLRHQQTELAHRRTPAPAGPAIQAVNERRLY